METIIMTIIIITIVVILTLWLRIKTKATKYMYFKPNFSPSIHLDEESESDVHKN